MRNRWCSGAIVSPRVELSAVWATLGRKGACVAHRNSPCVLTLYAVTHHLLFAVPWGKIMSITRKIFAVMAHVHPPDVIVFLHYQVPGHRTGSYFMELRKTPGTDTNKHAYSYIVADAIHAFARKT